MSEKDDEKKEPRRFIQSSREIINQLIEERKHGPKCPCDDCFIFLYEGARRAKEDLPGSYLVDHWEDKEQEDILPS